MKKRRRLSQCPNCLTQLNIRDNYCPNCGQENHQQNNSIVELWRDFIGSLINFDGKVWSTFKNLFLHPGKISSDYVAGKKARYVPPLKMYFFVSFVYFLILHFALDNIMNSNSITKLLEFTKTDVRFKEVEISRDDYCYLKDLDDSTLMIVADSILKKDTVSRFNHEKFIKLKNLNAIDSIKVDSIALDNNSIQFSNDIEIAENLSSQYNLWFFIDPKYDTIHSINSVTFLDLRTIYENPSKSREIIENQIKDILGSIRWHPLECWNIMR